MENTIAETGESPWSAVARSWLSMKLWVKVWLIVLNIVFLAGLAFDEPIVDWTMQAYLAAGILILAMALKLRGLARILGVAHLLPWLPLLGYVELRLASDIAGPQIHLAQQPLLFTWALTLWVTVAVCLAFDAIDVFRWFRGERYILGSEAAAAAGASSVARSWKS